MDNQQVEVEQLKEQEEIKTALKQTAGTKEMAPKPVAKLEDKLWFGTYLLVLLGLLALYYILGSDLIPAAPRYISLFRQLTIGAMLIVLVVGIAKSIRVYLISQIENRPARYNLTRVLNLLMVLAILIIGLSLLSANWYTALVSLGVLSLILGFALQTPIASLIGWVYLLIRQPYKVGDRIQIGEAKGDVIDVSYFDTTLWEFGGPYLSTQHPSGRIIKFPNSLVLSQTVYNYSWPLFPYIWNEIKFQVAYDSDLEFITQTMQQVVEEEIGEQMVDLVQVYRQLLMQTPVDELEIQERPVVHFRASENTWLEAIVRYLVHPKESGRVKTRLTKKLLDKLNAEPERVLFPKSNLR
ncbi:MAG TPA: mechanosensitive ion channel family protein [Anaerolineales bacterium]|nr:mechanosensitive ion channel family protein [Anaerolineales bacterium]